MLTPREQGDFGELQAMCIAELDGRLLRVQVKTTRGFRLAR